MVTLGFEMFLKGDLTTKNEHWEDQNRIAVRKSCLLGMYMHRIQKRYSCKLQSVFFRVGFGPRVNLYDLGLTGDSHHHPRRTPTGREPLSGSLAQSPSKHAILEDASSTNSWDFGGLTKCCDYLSKTIDDDYRILVKSNHPKKSCCSNYQDVLHWRPRRISRKRWIFRNHDCAPGICTMSRTNFTNHHKRKLERGILVI